MKNSKERIQYLQRTVGVVADGVIGNKTLTAFQCHFHVPTKAMVAHFFGNVYHETGGFTIAEENMNYTSAARIMQIWPSRFKTIASATPFVRNPAGLANSVYANRMGNGAPSSGDGYKYRGRGAIQTTGKWSYDKLGQYVMDDLLNNPELVANKYYWESAIFYFNDRKLWNLVSDISPSSIELIRRRINGGVIGLQDTTKWVHHYFNLIN